MNGLQKTKGRATVSGIISFIMMLIIAASVSVPVRAYAADNPVKLTARQTFVTSSTSSVDDTFTYKLQPIEQGTHLHLVGLDTESDGYTFTMSGNDSCDIGLLYFGEPGIYRYELYQLITPDRHGYIQDKRVYTIEAHVGPTLEVDLIVLNKDGSKTDSIEFHNEYRAYATDSSLMSDPLVVKTVSGNPSKDSVFSFSLMADDVAYPMPVDSKDGVKTIHITGSGKATFGTWCYEETGVYTYTIFEEKTGEVGYIYDTAIYTITDTVIEENTQLILSRVVTNSLNKRVTSCSFINKYSPGPMDNIPNTGIPGTPGTSNTGPKMGPKTGDSMNTNLHFGILVFGEILVACAVIYLIIGKRGDKHEDA